MCTILALFLVIFIIIFGVVLYVASKFYQELHLDDEEEELFRLQLRNARRGG